MCGFLTISVWLEAHMEPPYARLHFANRPNSSGSLYCQLLWHIFAYLGPWLNPEHNGKPEGTGSCHCWQRGIGDSRPRLVHDEKASIRAGMCFDCLVEVHFSCQDKCASCLSKAFGLPNAVWGNVLFFFTALEILCSFFWLWITK